jgi:AraC-like DNA-binding protein
MLERANPRPEDAKLSLGVFSTVNHPLPLQRELWASRWNSVIDMEFPEDDECGYPATNWFWDMRGAALSVVQAPPLVARRSAAHIRRDQIDSWLVTVARRGTVRHAAGNAVADAEAGVPILHSMGEAFESRRSTVHWVSLIFSRDLAHDINVALEAGRNRPLATPLGHLMADFILALEHRLHELTVGDLPALNGVVRQMIGACMAPSRDRLAEAAPALDETRRERIRVAIRRNRGLPSLSPEKLCRMVGMSRSHLYRLFEAEGGVARYITAQRMRAAYAALSDPANNGPIHAVAEAVGYVDAAGFSRSFRREFGCTPREVRAAAQLSCPSGDTVPPRISMERDLPALLRRL